MLLPPYCLHSALSQFTSTVSVTSQRVCDYIVNNIKFSITILFVQVFIDKNSIKLYRHL